MTMVMAHGRILGGAVTLLVVGIVLLVIGGAVVVSAIGWALCGFGGVVLVSLVFLLVGESEDRDRRKNPGG